VLTAAGDTGFDLLLDDGTSEHVAYDDVTQAHTVFEWGNEQQRTKSKNTKNKKTRKASSSKEPVRR